MIKKVGWKSKRVVGGPKWAVGGPKQVVNGQNRCEWSKQVVNDQKSWLVV